VHVLDGQVERRGLAVFRPAVQDVENAGIGVQRVVRRMRVVHCRDVRRVGGNVDAVVVGDRLDSGG
jgi:hypothetical protein